MALTENIKQARVNVSTGETDHVYYDEAEWAVIEADRAASVLPNAKAAAASALASQAQSEVDAIIKPPALSQKLARMNELLFSKVLGNEWTAEEAAQVVGFQSIFTATKDLRVREAAALAAVEAASAVADVESVVL